MNGSISISKAMFFLSVAVVLFALLTGCSKEEPWKSPVTVIETGYLRAPDSTRKAIWMNPERLAFLSNGEPGENWETGRYLYIFDISANRIIQHDKATLLFCAEGNRIRYTENFLTDSDGDRYSIHKFGEIGNEQMVISYKSGASKLGMYLDGRLWTPPAESTISDYTCDYHRAPAADYKNRIIKLLRPEHGFLDYGEKGLKNGFNQLTVFVRASDEARIKMPFTHETTVAGRQYYPVLNKYLLWRRGEGALKGEGWRGGYQVLPAWWLSPDGEVEEIYIPAEPWAKWGVSSFLHTARGYLIHSIDIKRGGQIGASGLYLTDLTPNRYVKVIAGVIKEVEVSPDGCSIFFSEIPRVGDRLADSLMEKTVPYPSVARWKLIDLCRDLPEGVLNHG